MSKKTENEVNEVEKPVPEEESVSETEKKVNKPKGTEHGKVVEKKVWVRYTKMSQYAGETKELTASLARILEKSGKVKVVKNS